MPEKQMLVFDCETNGLLHDLSEIHCIAIFDSQKEETFVFNNQGSDCYPITEGLHWLTEADVIVGHNIIGYDLPVIHKLYPWFNNPSTVVDTLLLSRLYHSDMMKLDKKHNWKHMPLKLYGRHSLESYGYRLGEFKGEFGFEPEIYHSSISSTKKSEIWVKIALGEMELVVGTRSALFLPFNNLGLIILDEEHDSSYKQEDGVILNSRDWAVLLAKKSNCKIILSTATPSIETSYNCHIKKYTKVSLTKRFNNTKLPEIEIVDMKKNTLDKNKWISNPLKNALKTCFNSGKQSLLFLNKRGYAPVVICTKCGYSISCPNCDFALVFHKNKYIGSDHVLICHHCNYQEKFKDICPKCKSEKCLTNAGPGIEKIYEEVSDFFPRKEICLLSSDTVKNKKNFKKIINFIQKKEIKIIIGTQIISKGHHFPNLETVGIINIDNLINSLDFRSSERAYQLITQVAGRSGRESSAGRVLVQTYHPESNIIEMCSLYQKEDFYKWELEKRKKYRLPPFVNLISIIIENNNPSIAKKHAYETISFLKKSFESMVFGPTPAPIFKLRNKYRYRILIKFEKSSIYKHKIRERLMKIIFNKGTKIKIDVDPYNFL